LGILWSIIVNFICVSFFRTCLKKWTKLMSSCAVRPRLPMDLILLILYSFSRHRVYYLAGIGKVSLRSGLWSQMWLPHVIYFSSEWYLKSKDIPGTFVWIGERRRGLAVKATLYSMQPFQGWWRRCTRS
jgi:hypothetical protein